MKYVNYLLLFLLLFFVFIFKDNIKPSTNLLSLFSSKESIQALEIATELGYTKEMLIAVKGFEDSSKNIVDELSGRLEQIDGIELVESKITPSKKIGEYYKKFYPILAEFDSKEQNSQSVNIKLKELYDSQLNSFFYTPIDKSDPLGLFRLDTFKNINFSSKDEYITLGDYGYLIKIKTDVTPSEMDKAKKLYEDVKDITAKYEDVIAFAGFFYTVENSQKIKEDITLIVAFSTILLFIIYLLFLRNVQLLIHTITTLISSMIFALLISLVIYDDIHVISLAFGMSISAVSIDYLFHYYFHDFYQKKELIDKSVLYGYLTTTAAFAIFSFIPVALIAQISLFTALSLSFSYIVFTFVFPFLELKEYKSDLKDKESVKIIPTYLISLLSIFFLIYAAFHIEFDTNIRNLDYQNLKLQQIEKTFKDSQKSKYYPVIVKAKSEDDLISNLHVLHENISDSFSLASFVPELSECLKRENTLKNYDFKSLKKIINEEANKIGFKSDYFSSSYENLSEIPSCKDIDINIFKSYNLSTFSRDGFLYTIAFVKNVNNAIKLDFIHSIDVKTMLEKVSQRIYSDIYLYSLIVLLVVFMLIFFSVKNRFFYAINYILFPAGVVLAFLVTFFEVNFMHIFSLIILIAIGIDYGIYMSRTDKPSNTMLAIKYSLLSTFAAFGVLVFSSITALNSIGLVITLGIAAIFILIKVMK